MQILRAAEDYLEAMLMMQQKHGYIRSIDIAEQLGVTKPSVTYTTKRLRENGYITMDRDGLITLTPSGMDIASRMLDRHHTLTKFLMELGVDAKTAEEDACKMEHDISEQTYTALCRHAIGKLGILGEDDAGLGETAGTDENLNARSRTFPPAAAQSCRGRFHSAPRALTRRRGFAMLKKRK